MGKHRHPKNKGTAHVRVVNTISPPEQHETHQSRERAQRTRYYRQTGGGTRCNGAASGSVWKLQQHEARCTQAKGARTTRCTSCEACGGSGNFDKPTWLNKGGVIRVSSGTGTTMRPRDGQREKVARGEQAVACSHCAECVAPEAGLKWAPVVIDMSGTEKGRVVAFTDTLSRPVTPTVGREVEENALLRSIWLLVQDIALWRAVDNSQWVSSHCVTARNKAGKRMQGIGSEGRRLCLARCADRVTDVEGETRGEKDRDYENGRKARRENRGALRDRVSSATKRTKRDRVGESMLERLGTSTSKHFECLRSVVERVTDQFE
ncbi:hypothetical protein TRVL_06930 [Trypanosoma vivax]|nr:hypothetical protein TRVL_06930 [Trypanosoma vivax]